MQRLQSLQKHTFEHINIIHTYMKTNTVNTQELKNLNNDQPVSIPTTPQRFGCQVNHGHLDDNRAVVSLSSPLFYIQLNHACCLSHREFVFWFSSFFIRKWHILWGSSQVVKSPILIIRLRRMLNLYSPNCCCNQNGVGWCSELAKWPQLNLELTFCYTQPSQKRKLNVFHLIPLLLIWFTLTTPMVSFSDAAVFSEKPLINRLFATCSAPNRRKAKLATSWWTWWSI